MDGYKVEIFFSPEDDAYVAQIPALVGCAADGPTGQEALANLREVKDAWVSAMQSQGHAIPPAPMSLRFAPPQKVFGGKVGMAAV